VEAERAAMAEVRRATAEAEAMWLGEGVACVWPGAGIREFSERLVATDAVFIRHLAPVDIVTGPGFNEIAEAVRSAAASIGEGVPFSTHVRFVGGARTDPQIRAGLELESQAASPGRFDRKSPLHVISAVVTPARAYVGVADVRHCLSSWPGGERRFRRDPNVISRAEFKLLEALEVFDLKLPTQGCALDLGAAPGGWTRLLLDHGLRVTAVDPAVLDKRLYGKQGLTHVQTIAQTYLSEAPTFDVITCDVRATSGEVAGILMEYASRLRPTGFVVATLKFPRLSFVSNDVLDTVGRCLRRLRYAYESVRARQIFHNRSEITVALVGPRRIGQERTGRRTAP